MKRIGILTSGGDSPGMNAVIRGVVRSGIFNDIEIYGIKNGYSGLINGDLVKMDASSVGDIIQRGGTILGTSRSREFKTPEGIKKALNVLEVYNIDSLVVAGGDGTFKGANELSKHGIKVGAIPCTIDNDLGYTDFTVGFFTAMNTVVEAIGNIRDTTDAHSRANVVEVMGRNCGDLALYSGIAGGAESILIPEEDYPIDRVAEKMLNGKNRGKRHHIIVVAEGIGNPYSIAEELQIKTGIETKVTVLGYLQRGGSPNVVDRIMASAMGKDAVDYLMEDGGSFALGIRGNQVVAVPLQESLEAEKHFNKNLYDILKILSI